MVAPPFNPFSAAVARFDLAGWCERSGFERQGRGKEWVHDCPFCGADGKFSISPSTRKWRCFICQNPCTLVDVLAEWEGSRARASQVILASTLARPGGLEYVPPLTDKVEVHHIRPPTWEPTPMDQPEYFEPLVDHNAYTYRRGFSLEHMIAIGAGVCTWGRNHDRIVFPVRRYPDGAWLYYQARAMWEKHEENNPKYYRKTINPPADEEGIHATAQDVMLGLELIISQSIRRVAIVEGPTDWVQVGPGAVAIFGKVVSDRHMQLLLAAGVTDIDVMLDPDAWRPPTRKRPDGIIELTGRPAPAAKACAKLSMLFRVRTVHFHEDTDPGTYTPTENAQWRATAASYGDGSRLSRV